MLYSVYIAYQQPATETNGPHLNKLDYETEKYS